MHSKIYTTILLFVLCVRCMMSKIIVEDTESYIPRIVEFASKVTNRWNHNRKTMIFINFEKVKRAFKLPDDVNVITYSEDYKPKIISNISCDATNNLELHPTTILMILEDSRSMPIDVLENHYKWTNYEVGTLVIIHPVRIISDLARDVWLKDLFRVCWTRNIAPVVIVYWSEETQAMNWFTFNIFKNELYNKTGEYDFTNLLSNISSDLYGYGLRSCFIDDPPNAILKNVTDEIYTTSGVDGEAYHIMVKTLNITDHLVKPFRPGTNNVIALHEYGNNSMCDVIFSSSGMPGNYRGIVNVEPVYMDHWCVMVPKSKPYTGLKKLILPFESPVWLMAMISLCAVFLYWQLITSLRLPWHLARDDHRLVVDYLFALLLNLGHPVSFHNLAQSSRILLVSMAFFGMLLSHIYHSLLFGFLTIPVYDDDLDTLEKVGLSGIKVLIPGGHMDSWEEINQPHAFPKKFVNSIVAEQSNDVFFRLIKTNNRNFAYILREAVITQILDGNKGQPIFHQVEECLYSLHRGYLVACNFPFTSRIEQIMNRIKEAGLAHHWIVSRQNAAEEDWYDDEQLHENSEPKAFSLNALLSAINLWIIGLIFSSCVFGLEILWWRIVKPIN